MGLRGLVDFMIRFIAGRDEITFIAFVSSSRPGETLCHGEAPLGCGKGTKSKT